MSGKITGQVWDLDLPHAEAWVLMSMADHAEHDGSNVFPSQPLIAWKTGYSVRQVRRIQDRLKALKILIPEGFGPHGTTLFRIDLSRAPLKPEFSRADKMSSEDKMSPNRTRPLFKARRVRQDNMSGEDKMSSEDISDTRPDIQMSDEPSLDPSLKLEKINLAPSDEISPPTPTPQKPRKIPKSQQPGTIIPELVDLIRCMQMEEFHCLAEETKLHEQYWDTQVICYKKRGVTLETFGELIRDVDKYYATHPEALPSTPKSARSRMNKGLEIAYSKHMRNLRYA